MLIRMYNDNPAPRHVRQVVDVLKNGGIIIFPTDTVYGLGCDIFHHRAIERVARLKGLDFGIDKFSFICYDLSSLSEYSKQVDNQTYKIMRKNLPGSFTFILEASGKVPKILKNKKKTKAEIQEVITYVADCGGMEYAELKMNQYRDKALAILDSYPDSEVKEALKEFVYYTTSRQK